MSLSVSKLSTAGHYQLIRMESAKRRSKETFTCRRSGATRVAVLVVCAVLRRGGGVLLILDVEELLFLLGSRDTIFHRSALARRHTTHGSPSEIHP